MQSSRILTSGSLTRIGLWLAVLVVVQASALNASDDKNPANKAPSRAAPAAARQRPAADSTPVRRQTPPVAGPRGYSRPNQATPNSTPIHGTLPEAQPRQTQPAGRFPASDRTAAPVQQQQPRPREFGRPIDRQAPGQQSGRSSVQPAAAPSYTTRPNVRVEQAPGNRQIIHAPNGGEIHMQRGRVADIRAVNGAVIHRDAYGMRRVEMVRPDGRFVVVNGRRSGYVQRAVIVNNHSYVQRTYVVHGAAFTRVYRPYAYRPGLVLHLYTPVRYYRPALYRYAFNPWARPVYYTSWGWGGSPWFGYYGGYFAPAPFYPTPAYWLADYIIAATLEQAYQDRVAAAYAMPAGYAASGQPGLTPDVKRAIADEVGRQLRQEQADAQAADSPVNANPFSGDTPHIFVANAAVEAVSGDQACSISEGDVLELRGAPPPDAAAANVLVLASERGCPTGSTVMVGLPQLAEMQNHMRETLDRGLGDLQARQGRGGLPPMTRDAAAPPVPVSWASQIRPDQGVEGELTQVSDEGEKAERETVNGAFVRPASDPQLPDGGTIGLNSTIGDVVAVFGQPLRAVDVGAKKIYFYKDAKITFQDGKVIDVE